MEPGIFTHIFKIFFVTSFLITSVIAVLIAFVFYLMIRPFNKRLYRNILWYLMIVAYSHVAFVSDWWSLLQLNLYMDKEDFYKYFSKEHALIIMNHSYEIDWLPLISICSRTNLLGNFRIFLKRSLQYIPVFGWSFILNEHVLLHRTYEKDEKIIRDSVKEFSNYPYPIWLVLYPEGTWFSEESHKISQKFAEKMSFPQLKYHLQPRTTGFVTTVTEMRGHIKAIYNMEIAFKQSVKPSVFNIVEGRQITAHIYIKRIPEKDIPMESHQQEAFLREMFQIKDRLRDSFNETGSFFSTSNVPIESPLKIERPLYIIPIFLLCCVCTTILLLYWITYLYQGYGLTILSFVVIVISRCFLAIFTIAVKSTEM